MKLLRELSVIVGLPWLALTYNPFKAAIHTPSVIDVRDQSDYDSEISLSALLEPRARKPEIYTKALLELKRLEEEPICHRIAAQMLMNDCQDLGEANDYQFNNAHLQRHYVESFAASLAICDLERGRFAIPGACTPFTSSVLLRVSNEKKKLEASPEQVGACLEALGQDHSHWNTWLSYRDKALLFCKAARIDIDKDQSISLHKQLAKVMNDLTDALENDLRSLRESMAEHARAADSYFQGAMAHAEDLKAKFQGTFESFSKDVTGITSSLKSALGSTSDVQRALRNIFDMAIQTKVEMAVAHDTALELTTVNAQSRMEGINEVAGMTEASMERLRDTVEKLGPIILSVLARQEALDQSSRYLYARIGNITEILEDHKENLELVSFQAADVQEILGKTAASAKSWHERMSLSTSSSDYLVLLGTSLTSLFAGNYGLPPSLPRNAGLLVGDMVTFRRTPPIEAAEILSYSYMTDVADIALQLAFCSRKRAMNPEFMLIYAHLQLKSMNMGKIISFVKTGKQ